MMKMKWLIFSFLILTASLSVEARTRGNYGLCEVTTPEGADAALYRPILNDVEVLGPCDPTLQPASWTITNVGSGGQWMSFNEGYTYDSIAQYNCGTWTLYNKDVSGTRTANWGNCTDKPFSADVDGDGDDDFVVYRPSTGDWYILYYGSLGYSIINWGISGDNVSIGDIDNDGYADLVVNRHSNHYWYVYYPRSNTYDASTIPEVIEGFHADAVGAGFTVADVDKDGEAEIVWKTFANFTGVWHVINYSPDPAKREAVRYSQFDDFLQPLISNYDGISGADFAGYDDGAGCFMTMGSNPAGTYSTWICSGVGGYGDRPISAYRFGT